MRGGLLALVALLLAVVVTGSAEAQNDATFDIDLSSQAAPVATWSTSPAGATCEASGLWSGMKAASGTETLAPLTDSGQYVLACSWLGESIMTLTWDNPTENTDGSPYENPQDTVLVWSEGSLAGATCDAGGELESTTRPPDQTMHTVTGLDPGTWSAAAFARNDLGLCSEISNVVTKVVTGEVTVTESIGVTVPAAITLSAE